jgi:hypothetical protein
MRNPVEVSTAKEAYAWTRDVYARAGVAGRFKILDRKPDSDPAAQYLELIYEWPPGP